jgi:hypothetical protein
MVSRQCVRRIEAVEVNFLEFGAKYNVELMKVGEARERQVKSDQPWPRRPIARRLCAIAAEYGNIPALAYARKQTCPWGPTAAMAADSNHLDVLKWAIRRKCWWDESTCRNAALKGHLALLKWAVYNGCAHSPQLLDEAARGGHLTVLQWVYFAKKWPLTADVLFFAVMSGKPEVVAWLHQMGCPRAANACSTAAGYGHFAILQSMRANGYPWDSQVYVRAARADRLDIFMWALDNDCPYDIQAYEYDRFPEHFKDAMYERDALN